MDDEGNKLYYDKLAESLNNMLTPEQRTLLQDENNYQHLTIRLLGCSAGKGNRQDSTDSFAAKLQRELKEQYGIYSTVIANTRSNFYETFTLKNMKIEPSFVLNTRYGQDERLFLKHLKYTSSTFSNSKKS
ncbi:hypothetical protein [Legionella tunisiensis]|uniref:hypothetical protein n=1 Tax=Legionella tunisiensis TaxID=1034944 RepID=UPI0002FD44A8|nr:hypothetical protein [Legionella tunisiensis]